MLKYLIIIPLPVFLFAVGVIMLNRPPIKFNYFVGYRTARSMRDIRSWEWAQKMMNEYFIYYALIILASSIVFSIICRILFDRAFIPAVIILFQAIGILGVILKIESNLKKEHKRWDEK